ncbi:MAG TPA: hypothetical protein VJ957_07385 [Longimicrobiales bacterium]|nr:hypothetical protein [Trueperaceae bacterium]HKJ92973.1 hypothetical protein [Longimicrobiales bacterium]
MRKFHKAVMLLLGATVLLALTPALAASTPAPVNLTMVVMHSNKVAGVTGKPGPDGTDHDAFVPSDMVIQPGQKVTLTVINYDDGDHSITAPEINLNLVAKGGTFTKDASGKETGFTPGKTVFTFTAPSKPGYYRWFCALPCDGPTHWGMSKGFDGMGQDGYMAGYIVVR